MPVFCVFYGEHMQHSSVRVHDEAVCRESGGNHLKRGMKYEVVRVLRNLLIVTRSVGSPGFLRTKKESLKR